MVTNKNKANITEANFEGPFKVICCNKGDAYILKDTNGSISDKNYTPSESCLISHKPDELMMVIQLRKIIDPVEQLHASSAKHQVICQVPCTKWLPSGCQVSCAK
jgi:hypothetical protein